jgi:hypothetical protein
VAALAATLLFAADDALKYEMANYVVGFPRKGPNHGARRPGKRAYPAQAHLANINRMAAAGNQLSPGLRR